MKVAYCRVSTEKESQISSLTNQIRYFTQLGIEPQNIYADEGISGTKIRKRPQLNKLLYDCGIDIEQHGGDELDIIYKQSNRPTEITDNQYYYYCHFNFPFFNSKNNQRCH